MIRANAAVANAIGGMLSRLGSGPIFVHSDPFRAAKLVKPVRDRDALIDSHLALLLAAAQDRALWMPSFNYDFPRTRTFDVARDPSQLGPIPERFRVSHANWRTEIPMFSGSGTGDAPPVAWGDRVDPFGPDSLFAHLVNADGSILYYGDTFHYNTVVHYAERVAGGPPYRYDKLFEGTVIRADGKATAGSLNYHVRPSGTGLEYDWARLLERAIDAGACSRVTGHSEVLVASATSVTQFFVDAMREDPLALLDTPTRKWVEPRLEALGRRFLLSDFETNESS